MNCDMGVPIPGVEDALIVGFVMSVFTPCIRHWMSKGSPNSILNTFCTMHGVQSPSVGCLTATLGDPGLIRGGR
jgi:hypothetical protein